MRLCPICDKGADSEHHLRARAIGGTNENRNIIWLCKSCHDECEGKDLSPQMIIDLRREKRGIKETSKEEYWWLYRDDGRMFIGIKVPGQPIIHYHIFFPHDSQLGWQLYDWDAHEKAVPKIIASHTRRGRPKVTILPELLPILQDKELSMAQKAKLLGLGKTTIASRMKDDE